MDTQLQRYAREEIGAKSKTNRAKSFFHSRLMPDKELAKEAQRIIEAALEAKQQWIEAGIDFNYADDELLVDYHIYRLKACEARYTYFLKLAKEKGLTLA